MMFEKEGNGSDGVCFVKWFSELNRKDIEIAGMKGASLSETHNNRFPVPPGFVVTTDAFRTFIEKSDLKDVIGSVKNRSLDEEKTFGKIKELIMNVEMPSELKEEIIEAYDVLDVHEKDLEGTSEDAMSILRAGKEPAFVAVRTSSVSEGEDDNREKSVSFLNVKGHVDLTDAIKNIFASSSGKKVAVIVQKMVDANKAGRIYSKNPVKNDEMIVINAVWGLGDGVVSEGITPDDYLVNSDLKLIDKKISNKKVAVVRNSSGEREIIRLSTEVGKREVLTGHEIKMLSQFAKRLEDHYGEPQDVEFAIDKDKIYVVDCKPVRFEVPDEESEEVVDKDNIEQISSDNRQHEIQAMDNNEDEEEKLKVLDIDEEEEILKALGNGDTDLDDEYRPSVESAGSSRVHEKAPDLNEAIPISSEDFESEKKDEEMEVNSGNTPELTSDDEVIDEMLPDEGVESEPTENEDGKEKEENPAYEMQLDAIFDKEVEVEMQQSEAREAAVKQITGQNEGGKEGSGENSGGEGRESKGNDEILDIF